MSFQDTMRALSDPTRRAILNLLKQGPMTFSQLAEPFAISTPAVSKHISILKEAGLLRDRRDGKYVFYELNASVLEEVLLWIQDLRRDPL